MLRLQPEGVVWGTTMMPPPPPLPPPPPPPPGQMRPLPVPSKARARRRRGHGRAPHLVVADGSRVGVVHDARQFPLGLPQGCRGQGRVWNGRGRTRGARVSRGCVRACVCVCILGGGGQQGRAGQGRARSLCHPARLHTLARHMQAAADATLATSLVSVQVQVHRRLVVATVCVAEARPKSNATLQACACSSGWLPHGVGVGGRCSCPSSPLPPTSSPPHHLDSHRQQLRDHRHAVGDVDHLRPGRESGPGQRRQAFLLVRRAHGLCCSSAC